MYKTWKEWAVQLTRSLNRVAPDIRMPRLGQGSPEASFSVGTLILTSNPNYDEKLFLPADNALVYLNSTFPDLAKIYGTLYSQLGDDPDTFRTPDYTPIFGTDPIALIKT